MGGRSELGGDIDRVVDDDGLQNTGGGGTNDWQFASSQYRVGCADASVPVRQGAPARRRWLQFRVVHAAVDLREHGIRL